MVALRGERERVLVGNGQAFWGDSMSGAVDLVRNGPLHYLTLDYLAEVSMSLLGKARRRDPRAGYAADFVSLLEEILPECHERGIRIIANAGGVNGRGCADAVVELASRSGCDGLKVAVVEGDDVLDDLPALLDHGHLLRNLDNGEDLLGRHEAVQSANAYFGAWPIVAALAGGADIVITGRCTDASLTVAPLAYEFGWAPTDYDLLAAATAAGHIIECGTQCTGGNFEGWRDITGWVAMGFPIVQATSDGAFVVTKHPGSGGAVTSDTVTAQLLYEIGDPKAYETADVVADFSRITLRADGVDRVAVQGVKGYAPSDTYKISCTLAVGHKAVGQLTVPGPDAVEKARLTATVLFDRLAALGVRFAAEDQLVECLGQGVVIAGPDEPMNAPPEVVLRISVRHKDRNAVDRFSRELASLLTSGPPGLTGFAGGRPKVGEVLEHWPALLSKEAAVPTIAVFTVGEGSG